jgi:uncharacterized membrane protein YfcA
MFLDLSTIQILLVALLFIWAGFVRSGLGFGGAALGLPLMLFIDPDPLTWLPIIGTHLLFFSSLTLRTRMNNVDWDYLKQSSIYIVPAALVGVIGLISLPTQWLLVFIYSITLFYALIWFMNWAIESNNPVMDRFLLSVGGYVAGTSLTGAPLMVSVFMRNVSQAQLRNTLFVLWFALVTIKMSAFAALGVELHIVTALLLLPVAAIGHLAGLKTHEMILQNDRLFKRWVGGGLLLVSLLGLWNLWFY